MTRPDEGDPFRGRAGGHTFAVRARVGEPGLSTAACAPCHGDTAPDDIGRRDWDGDGAEGRIADEHAAAVSALNERLRARIAAEEISDSCTPSAALAADVAELDARLVLVDAMGRALGDCDADGRVDEGESWVSTRALSRRLGDAAYDLALLRADGSAGRHNPAYAFRMIEALSRALPAR